MSPTAQDSILTALASLLACDRWRLDVLAIQAGSAQLLIRVIGGPSLAAVDPVTTLNTYSLSQLSTAIGYTLESAPTEPATSGSSSSGSSGGGSSSSSSSGSAAASSGTRAAVEVDSKMPWEHLDGDTLIAVAAVAGAMLLCAVVCAVVSCSRKRTFALEQSRRSSTGSNTATLEATPRRMTVTLAQLEAVHSGDDLDPTDVTLAMPSEQAWRETIGMSQRSMRPSHIASTRRWEEGSDVPPWEEGFHIPPDVGRASVRSVRQSMHGWDDGAYPERAGRP